MKERYRGLDAYKDPYIKVYIPDALKKIIHQLDTLYPKSHPISPSSMVRIFKETSGSSGTSWNFSYPNSYTQFDDGLSRYNRLVKNRLYEPEYYGSSRGHSGSDDKYIFVEFSDLGHHEQWKTALEWELLKENKSAHGRYVPEINSFGGEYAPVDLGAGIDFVKRISPPANPASYRDINSTIYLGLVKGRILTLVKTDKVQDSDVREVLKESIDWDWLEELLTRINSPKKK